MLFHDHGHSHGDHSNGEGESANHTHDLESGEHVHPHPAPHLESRPTSSSRASMDDSGPISDILPETIVRRASNAGSRPRPSFDRSPAKRKGKRTSRQSFASADDIYVSPAANRQYVINQAQEIQSDLNEEDVESGAEEGYNGDTAATMGTTGHKRSVSIPHEAHHHSKPKDSAQSGGHSHENLNMRGVFLHVLGDALGNVGVIATALFIWLTDFSWRFYSDPVISLVITAIIFSSALPLVKSASLILLQGVPRGISLEDVKEDMLQVPTFSNQQLIIDRRSSKCPRSSYLATL